MDSNTHSNQPAPGPAWPDGLAPLAADVEALATQDLAGLSDTGRVQRLLAWRRLLDRQEGLWLRELADLDARGAPGPSWIRRRCRPPAGCVGGCG